MNKLRRDVVNQKPLRKRRLGTIPGHWKTNLARKTMNELNQILKLRFYELHVTEVRKRGKRRKIGDMEYTLSDIDTQKMSY